jgi:hypothetical protein
MGERDGITKGERDELRRIVRGDFKALKAEIGVRQAELEAEIEKRVAQRFVGHEETIQKAQARLAEIAEQANAQIGDVVLELQRHCDGYTVYADPFTAPRLRFHREKRDEMRRAMLADLEARVAHANARMQRQEIDLLKKLSFGALESTEAKAFLTEIPTVAELVPVSRLAALEAQFGEEGTDD